MKPQLNFLLGACALSMTALSFADDSRIRLREGSSPDATEAREIRKQIQRSTLEFQKVMQGRSFTLDSFAKPVTGLDEIKSRAKSLGDTSTDLIFVPLAPCAIFDSRFSATGRFAVNQITGVDVTAVSDYSFQGGAANNCGLGDKGSVAAVAMAVTGIFASQSGTFKVWPLLEAEPSGIIGNFYAGGVDTVFTIAKLDQGASANEMNIKTVNGNPFVNISVAGYFYAPQATPLQCEDQESAGTTIAAGSLGTQSTPACSAGYTIVGGGCSNTSFDGRVVTSRTFPATADHFCAFRNEGSGTSSVKAYSRCCRVPGL